MQLIYSPASPFVRKVCVLMEEAGIADQISKLPVATTALATAPEALAANPTGKIPALTRTDGPAIYDSRVICRYLDDRAESGLYPDTRLWEVLTLEATADAIMESGIAMVYEARLRPPEKQFDGWIEAQWGKIARAVSVINERWMSHLNGPLDMSHIAVACALGYLDFRMADRAWRKGNDALDDWYATFSQRPSMQATEPE
ncbi:glutathione S-transferase [Litorivita pollutaquae]|uniref:Glutathione S-transferase n=1 Tax=Litorivita pollutaquae TaxID=2200892 RepID=A0A2V4NCK2_9RHOB|nr:glutathione S-transferase [Litorivita pollutaquae]PYC47480.1 glutathione S-transferase [Litorivita pollutaquae]